MTGKGILDFDFMIRAIPRIAQGVPVSLAIAGVAFFFGVFIGLGIALVKIKRIPVLFQVTAVYTSFMRGTPLLAQIFLCYYGFPLVLRHLNNLYSWNLNISGIPAIFFMYYCFSLNVGAYLSESIRAALLSVPRGQIEAASSLGMTDSQGFLRVTLPQAALVALPNMGNTFIALLKDTSLAFAASVPEIIGQAKITAARSSNFLEAYIVAALFYWIICIILEQALALSESRLRKHERKATV
jgi:His/Glu/Gln/Arg/opine family amino acid ABC transporter permease subunit